MKITITPTSQMTSVRGQPVRVWAGETEDGIPVQCFVALVAVPEGRPPEDYRKLEEQLRACQVSHELVWFDYRMVAGDDV